MAEKYPYYPFYVEDFDDDEKVIAMSFGEVGLYILCLNRSWRHGSLPDDPEQIALLTRKKASEAKRLWPAVRACYIDRGDGRLVNRKQEEIRASVAGKSAKAKKAVEARWERERAAKSDTDVLRTNESRIDDVVPRAFDSLFVSVSGSKKQIPSVAFQANCERVVSEYPREIDDEDMRHFLSFILTAADQELFFSNLPLYAATWEPQFVPKLENFLRKGTWKIAPKRLENSTRSNRKLTRWEQELRDLEARQGS